LFICLQHVGLVIIRTSCLRFLKNRVPLVVVLKRPLLVQYTLLCLFFSDSSKKTKLNLAIFPHFPPFFLNLDIVARIIALKRGARKNRPYTTAFVLTMKCGGNRAGAVLKRDNLRFQQSFIESLHKHTVYRFLLNLNNCSEKGLRDNRNSYHFSTAYNSSWPGYKA